MLVQCKSEKFREMNRVKLPSLSRVDMGNVHAETLNTYLTNPGVQVLLDNG